MAESTDHDLLVRLDVKLDALAARLDEARLSVAGKADNATVAAAEAHINRVETSMTDRANKSDTRFEALQLKVYMMLGGLVALEVVLKFLHL